MSYSKREFSSDEIKYIQDNYKDTTIRAMAKHLGISHATVANKLKEMGLNAYTVSDFWTELDIHKLKTLSMTHSLTELAEELDRTENSVRLKAKKLGIPLYKSPRTWTIEEIDYLRRNWGEVSVSKIAKDLHRTETGVIEKAHKLKLKALYNSYTDIPLGDFCRNTGISRDRITRYLVIHYDFPLITRKPGKVKYYYFVQLDKILDWMKKHQSLFDASRIKEGYFAVEPDWLRKKRAEDRESIDNINYQIVKKAWTREEERYAIDLIGIGLDYNEIGARLRRSPKSVAYRLRSLGYSYRLSRFWRGKEYKFIRDNWQIMSDEEMANKLNRPVKSVAAKRAELGFSRDDSYSEEELKYIQDNWESKTDAEMGNAIGRSEVSIMLFRRRLGLYRSETLGSSWTDREVDYILMNWDTMSDKDIANYLNRTENAVKSKRIILGLSKRKSKKLKEDN